VLIKSFYWTEALISGKHSHSSSETVIHSVLSISVLLIDTEAMNAFIYPFHPPDGRVIIAKEDLLARWKECELPIYMHHQKTEREQTDRRTQLVIKYVTPVGIAERNVAARWNGAIHCGGIHVNCRCAKRHRICCCTRHTAALHANNRTKYFFSNFI